MDIDNKITDILEEYVSCGDKYISDRCKDMLFELEPVCRETSIFKNAGRDFQEAPEFLKCKTSLELFRHMCLKIANAPTWLHAAGTPRLMIPLICERLRQEEKEQL
ncbi:MAG: hypothetical protein IJ719_14895 [Clostridia bacterium]|nr:hypothetical protein [Clostridia bacterium]